MTPHYADGAVTLYHGDCLVVLRTLPDASVDAVVTDPPYGLEFMGREWDGADGFRRSLNPADAGRDSVYGRTSRTSPEYRTGKPANSRIRTRVDQRTNPAGGKSTTSTPESYVAGPLYQQWCQAWAAECLRVLKPGGHLLAFGGTRTVHRLTCAIEDAGFEIRDGIDWIYASGFPKSLDVSKAIDKSAGVEREVVALHPAPAQNGKAGTVALGGAWRESPAITAPATDESRRWSGWGTALKPAREPIVVARKPLAGTVAANVQAYGTGALNIDATRVGEGGHLKWATPRGMGSADSFADDAWTQAQGRPHAEATESTVGRWPSNVVFTHTPACNGECVPGCPVAELDRQSGVLTSGANPTRRSSDKFRDAYGDFQGQTECEPARGADSGGASRFFPVFRYEAKAPTAERPRTGGVAHPTVKPLDLMRWLVRLVTPPGGLVLDPFAGSGTTAEACVVEGLRCVAIEREADYLPLIVGRLSKPLQVALPLEVAR